MKNKYSLLLTALLLIAVNTCFGQHYFGSDSSTMTAKGVTKFNIGISLPVTIFNSAAQAYWGNRAMLYVDSSSHKLIYMNVGVADTLGAGGFVPTLEQVMEAGSDTTARPMFFTDGANPSTVLAEIVAAGGASSISAASRSNNAIYMAADMGTSSAYLKYYFNGFGQLYARQLTGGTKTWYLQNKNYTLGDSTASDPATIKSLVTLQTATTAGDTTNKSVIFKNIGHTTAFVTGGSAGVGSSTFFTENLANTGGVSITTDVSALTGYLQFIFAGTGQLYSRQITGGDKLWFLQNKNYTLGDSVASDPVTIKSLFSAGPGLTYTAGVYSISATAVTPAAYGSTTAVPVITINQQGQITAAANQTILIPDNLQFATNANTTGTGSTSYGVFVKLPTAITANRVLTIPAAGNAGFPYKIWNQNTNTSGFTWSIVAASGSVLDAAGNVITTLVNQSVYEFISDGTNYVKIN